MAEYIVNRPDEEVMRRILQQNPDNAVGAILRLAWQAGLLREEIQTLTWAQIDFQDRRIVLPDREVPLRRSWPIGWRRCAGSATAVPRRWCSRTGTASL